MAKRRSRRGHYTTATDQVSDFVSRPVTLLTEIEDRRLYHPDGPDRPVLSVSGVPSFVTLEPEVNRNVARSSRKQSQRANSTKARLVFAAGRDAVVGRMHAEPSTPLCVRRKTRREVIFAKGKGGSRHLRRVRRTRNSDIGC